MSDKKQEIKRPEKSQPVQDKPKPYPLRNSDYSDEQKNVTAIERSVEDNKWLNSSTTDLNKYNEGF